MTRINEYCSASTCDGYDYYGSGCSSPCECQEWKRKGIKYKDRPKKKDKK